MAPRKIIFDTDPGQDDAFALLFALGAPDVLEVVGVTAVAGNVPLARTETNARKVLELAGRPDVPVHAGCERPMVKALFTAEYVHGETGLDGFEGPEPTMTLQPKHAVDYLVDAIMAAPEGELTVCTLGPMTNLAMAMVKQPRIVGRLREVVLMGGDHFQGGNVTPAAEFNIFVDPHAAHVVFSSGVPLTMAGLDCTHTAMMTPQWLRDLRALGTNTGVQGANMAEFFQRFGNAQRGTEGRPLHDACVTGYLLRPELYEQRRCNVRIEYTSPDTMGRTIVDWWNVLGLPANVNVLGRIDAPAFFAEMLARLATLP